MGANMLLAIGGILLFGMFLKSSNNLMTSNSQVVASNEYYVAAISIAQSVIDEAKLEAFDSRTVSGTVSSPSLLTRWDSLGQDGVGEKTPVPDTAISTGFASASKFNDMDDFNGYTRVVNTSRAEGYKVTVKVSYASPTFPDSVYSAARSYCKLMTVAVWSKYMSDTLKLQYAFFY